MSRGPSASRSLRLAVATLTLAAAAAADERSECIPSYVKTQELRRDGKLILASERAAACGRDVCPAAIRDDCVTWARELESSVPTVVFSVKGEGQDELTRATVRVDGVVLEGALDGRAHAIDPGPHALRVDAPGYATRESSVLVREGEHLRDLSFALTPLAASGEATRPAARPRSLTPVVVSGAAGAAGLGVFATFGLWGYYGSPGYRSLEACEGHCAPGDVDAVRGRFLVSDVGLAIGLVGVGVAAFLWFSGGRGEAPAAASARWVARPGGLAVTF